MTYSQLKEKWSWTKSQPTSFHNPSISLKYTRTLLTPTRISKWELKKRKRKEKEEA